MHACMHANDRREGHRGPRAPGHGAAEVDGGDVLRDCSERDSRCDHSGVSGGATEGSGVRAERYDPVAVTPARVGRSDAGTHLLCGGADARTTDGRRRHRGLGTVGGGVCGARAGLRLSVQGAVEPDRVQPAYGGQTAVDMHLRSAVHATPRHDGGQSGRHQGRRCAPYGGRAVPHHRTRVSLGRRPRTEPPHARHLPAGVQQEHTGLCGRFQGVPLAERLVHGARRDAGARRIRAGMPRDAGSEKVGRREVVDLSVPHPAACPL
eukprot:ctg_2757.g590